MASFFDSQLFAMLSEIFKVAWVAYPIWLPLVLGALFMEMWMHYIRSKFIDAQGSVLLEIRLPEEVTRTAFSMEVFLTALWQKGSAPWHEVYIDGKIRPWFSLEIASIGGAIHFYIWTWPKFRDIIEAHLYGQFPDIEIREVEDYTKWAYHDPVNLPMWATYYKKGKEDVVPIKTYLEFGLEKAADKEEHKTDPLSSLLEFMGSIGPGEQIWIQILIQAHRKVSIKDGFLFTREDWTGRARDKIQHIKQEEIIVPDPNNPMIGFGLPTKTQNDMIAGIERNISKWPFEVGMRGLYIATKEASKIGLRVPGVIGAWRAFSSPSTYYNELRIGKFTDFDYPFEDFMRIRRSYRERRMLDAYKKRSFFHPPHKYYNQDPFVMSTEEIATIWHLPGQVAKVPTLERIPSKKADAPANLPI